MAVDELAQHLARFQHAQGASDRLRAITATSRTLAGLSTAERSVLARALADRGVPELAARVDPAWVGRLDPEELTRVAEALQTLDQDRRAELVASLGEPGTLQPPGLPPPPPPAPPRAEPRAHEPRADELEPVPDHPEPAPGELEPVPEGPEAVRDVRAAEPEPDPGEPEEVHEEPAPVPEVVPEPAPEQAAPARTDLAEVVAALRVATTPRQRLAVADELVGARLDTGGLLEVVRAVPDGWQRRMLTKRLLALTVPLDIDAAAVVAAFDRDADRTAVGYALVSGGLAHVETVTDQLPARAADRLRRRSARVPAGS